MASLEDILAATEILAENSDNQMGGLGSIAEENRYRVSDVKTGDGGSAATAVASNQIVDTEIKSTIDINSGLGDMEEESIGVGKLSCVLNGGATVTVNGIDVRVGVDGPSGGVLERDEKIKDGEGSCTDNVNGRKSSYGNLNGDEKGQRNDEKLRERGFRVGDFVWGKIRSHPWWPGQVYDSGDASEFAMKHSQEDRLLIAFFGDGSCSWCLPSQLVPFVQNFKEMSADSTSKSFFNAIQSAVNEVGRLVESEMTCKCIAPEKRDGLARPLVSNAGVKAEVLAPEVSISRLSIPAYKPAEVLSEVMHLAKAVSIDSMLEFAVLRSWLSAFYCANGGHRLPIYCEPLHVEGMEDNNRNENQVANDFSIPIEVPILRPPDDDWEFSPTAVNGTMSLASSDGRIYHRRKQKSVAELMGENTKVKPKSRKRDTKAGEDVCKSRSFLKRKTSNDGKVEEGCTERHSSTRKMGRKRRVEVSESPKITAKKVSNAENCGAGQVDGASEGTLFGKPKNIEVAAAENASGEAREESEEAYTPRERKKSKYLCPPYTSPKWRMRNASFKMETEYEKIAKVDQVGELRTKGSGDLCATTPVPKYADKASDEVLPAGSLKGLDTTVNATPRTVMNDKKMTFAVGDVNVPVNGLLSEIQFAAVDPLYLSKKGSLETVWAFVSAHRSSNYLHGPDYKVFQKCKTGRKRKSLNPQVETDIVHEQVKSAELKTRKSVKIERKSVESRSKKSAEISCARNRAKKLDGNASSCIILTFSPKFPLPSKEEIVRLFGKYGTLNNEETNVVTGSHSAQVVYMRDSDAEAAFKLSINQRPFGVKNVVNYCLLHSLAGFQSHGSYPKFSSFKQAPDKPDYLQTTTDESFSDIRVIRKKLEIMSAILENYHTKFSLDDKSSLKDEMKSLLENVETVSEKVQVMAENTSS